MESQVECGPEAGVARVLEENGGWRRAAVRSERDSEGLDQCGVCVRR